GRAETLHSDRFLDDLDTLPGDEQWFVRGGWLTCHWSQPLNGDRPERMARRIDEFVSMMERHMLRLPRGL
ncbi:MAG TPA: hypothetical protein VEB22_03240, partial [Phycisphaerales bacterium]|nr:hypothetical protein [Phycisphaerales bacterium]